MQIKRIKEMMNNTQKLLDVLNKHRVSTVDAIEALKEAYHIRSCALIIHLELSMDELGKDKVREELKRALDNRNFTQRAYLSLQRDDWSYIPDDVIDHIDVMIQVSKHKENNNA
jgi:hypothetical protein